MKTLTLALAALAVTAGAAPAETVTITLNGVEARPGRVMASLNTRDQFLRAGPSYTAVAEPVAGGVTLTFENVAPGDYALMVMHDLNANDRFDFGTDGWAFSNSARPMTGPPAFDDRKFTVASVPVTLTETLRYGSDGRTPARPVGRRSSEAIIGKPSDKHPPAALSSDQPKPPRSAPDAARSVGESP